MGPKTVDLRTKEQKIADFKYSAKNTWNGIARFVRDNIDVLAVVAPAAGLVFNGVCKVTSKAIAERTLNKELDFKKRTIYDRSLGEYVELKKPLSVNQKLEYERRRATGEKVNTILNDMKVLKR